MAHRDGVYLENGTLEFRGERVKVGGVVAKAVAHLLAAPDEEPEDVIVGAYRLGDLGLLKGKRMVRLTKSEVVVMRKLMARPGCLVRRDALLYALYRDRADEPEHHVLSVFVSGLRRKFLKAGVALRIEVASGLGYVLRASSP